MRTPFGLSYDIRILKKHEQDVNKLAHGIKVLCKIHIRAMAIVGYGRINKRRPGLTPPGLASLLSKGTSCYSVTSRAL
jgi:hypothetical protein